MCSSRLYFDASNVISWGPQPVVGIPRVETALVREALRSGHHMVLYDRGSRNLRLLSEAELQHLRQLLQAGPTLARTGPPPSSMRERLAQVRDLASLSQGRAGPEFERYLAGVLAGDWRRKGIGYHAAKLLVRTGIRLGRGSRPPHSATAESRAFLDDPSSRVFLSSRTTHELTYAGRIIKARTFAILHDLIPLAGEPFFTARNAARFRDEATWMADACTRVLCPSDHTRKQAAALFAGHAGKFHTTRPAGLLFEATQGQEARTPRLPDDFPAQFAIYCATIEPRKNHAMLAGVWERLHERLGPACPALYLVGRWGWKCAEAEARIGAAQRRGAPIAILSALSDAELIWLYRHAAFGVYPSLAEGFGLGVAECLDFGLPTLISDAPSLAEAAQGLMPVLPASDADAWLDAIERLVRDPRSLSVMRATITATYARRSAREFFQNVADLMQE